MAVGTAAVPDHRPGPAGGPGLRPRASPSPAWPTPTTSPTPCPTSSTSWCSGGCSRRCSSRWWSSSCAPASPGTPDEAISAMATTAMVLLVVLSALTVVAAPWVIRLFTFRLVGAGGGPAAGAGHLLPALLRPPDRLLRLRRHRRRPAQRPPPVRGADVRPHPQQRGGDRHLPRLRRHLRVVGQRRGGGRRRRGQAPPGPGDHRRRGRHGPGPLALRPPAADPHPVPARLPPPGGAQAGRPVHLDPRLRGRQPDRPRHRPGAGQRGPGRAHRLLHRLRLLPAPLRHRRGVDHDRPQPPDGGPGRRRRRGRLRGLGRGRHPGPGPGHAARPPPPTWPWPGPSSPPCSSTGW